MEKLRLKTMQRQLTTELTYKKALLSEVTGVLQAGEIILVLTGPKSGMCYGL